LPRRRSPWWLLGAGLIYGAVNVVILAHPPYLVFCLLWVVWMAIAGYLFIATTAGNLKFHCVFEL
jgi:hypothetical protein